jgi:hypothetical protein
MSEEEREAKRASAQASGMGGMGQAAGMSEEDRAAKRATAEASGMIPGSGSGGGVQGLSAGLLNPLVELLTQRAAG